MDDITKPFPKWRPTVSTGLSTNDST